MTNKKTSENLNQFSINTKLFFLFLTAVKRDKQFFSSFYIFILKIKVQNNFPQVKIDWICKICVKKELK